MSEDKDRSTSAPGATEPPRRTVATFHKSGWPGWIWGVPVAAVAVVLWLSLRALSTGGTDITVVFDEAAGMSVGSTTVQYRGLNVGTLEDLHLDLDGRHVVATLNIDDSVMRWLDTGTHFYLAGAHPSLSNPASLKAIIAGPTLIMAPGAGKPARRFIGIEGEPPLPLLAMVSYRLRFGGAVAGLGPGAPVTLRGFTVGEVTDVRLTVDPASGAISTPVTIVLDPTRFHLDGAAPPPDGNWAPVMNAALAKMVAKGLRASLTRVPPLIGGQQVTLETLPDAPPKTLLADGDSLRIPVAPPSGPAQLMTKLNQLPIDAIAGNVRAITQGVRTITDRVDTLVASPKIVDSLNHLDSTLAELDRTVHAAGPQIAPTIHGLQKTADQIDATAKAVQTLAGDGPDAPDGNLRSALQELTRAARAIRSLANYLDRHPGALIRGR